MHVAFLWLNNRASTDNGHTNYVMNKVNVILNLGGQSVTQKLAFGNQILEAMTGNSNFTIPFPALGDLQIAISDLNLAIIAAKPGDKVSTLVLHEKEKTLEMVLKALCSYVEYQSRGNENIALTSGFSIKKPKTAAAKTFMAKNGDTTGVAELVTKSEGNAAYVWQYTKDPIGSIEWTDAGVSVKASLTVTGLSPLTNYWFRVAVVNSSGQQNWSDPFHLIVL